MSSTDSKKRYIKEWHSYINGLNALLLTPSEGISLQVSRCISELKILVRQVAQDKGLK